MSSFEQSHAQWSHKLCSYKKNEAIIFNLYRPSSTLRTNKYKSWICGFLFKTDISTKNDLIASEKIHFEFL